MYAQVGQPGLVREVATRTAVVLGSGYTLGTNVFAGLRPSNAPDVCILVANRVPTSAALDGSSVIDYPIQWFARGGVQDIHGSESLIYAVWRMLQAVSDPLILTSWNVMSSLGSGPGYIALDDRSRPEWSLNAVLKVKLKP